MPAQDTRRIGFLDHCLPSSAVRAASIEGVDEGAFRWGEASRALFRELSRAIFCSLESSPGYEKVP